MHMHLIGREYGPNTYCACKFFIYGTHKELAFAGEKCEKRRYKYDCFNELTSEQQNSCT